MFKRVVLIGCLLVLIPVVGYFAGNVLLDLYIMNGARRLVSLEKQGRLSSQYGYVWQEINMSKQMKHVSNSILEGNDTLKAEGTKKNRKKNIHFPSLAAVAELNKIRSLYKTIQITDRYGIPLAELRTTHTCVQLSELHDLLLTSLIITEDKDFHKRSRAYDYRALVRASLVAALRSVLTLRFHYPQGSSTIHMQVARFLLMKYDTRGYAYAERSISRKIRELKLAQALKMIYSNEEILTVYINHCVSASKGMRGYHDISMGLFGVAPQELDTCQNLYLARLVKWNRHTPHKIIRQIKASLPALAGALGWNQLQQQTIRQALDTLSFIKTTPLIPRHSHLIDLANEYWREVCRLNGMSESQLHDMDIADPESMIRRYGNVKIMLTIDYRLQRFLERLVDSRGFGPDTVIRTDIRIGSYGKTIQSSVVPPDTVRKVWIVSQDSLFIDPETNYKVKLSMHDTLLCNIRYRKIDTAQVRRSCYYYKRDTLTVPGQYYAYALMDSRTQQLLAYYSRDRLGSRLGSLLKNRTPNGSCIAKPMLFALAYDLGVYKPTDMASDDQPIPDTCAWARHYLEDDTHKKIGMVYLNASDSGGYQVHNYHHRFDGYDYLFNHLAHSNNIICVETAYRLNTDSANSNEAYQKNLRRLLGRIGAESLLEKKNITGPEIYAAIARICGVAADTLNLSGKRKPFPSDNYSIALGTLELSLYEQLHLFNILYGNTLVVQPSAHPSLFIKGVELGNKSVAFRDSVTRYRLFDNIHSVHPVHLGMHKRLLSNQADRLGMFDICTNDNENPSYVSNFAKSGTTDDIIRPYYADPTDTLRTNYGLWNAVLRLKLTKEDLQEVIDADTMLQNRPYIHIPYDSIPDMEVMDVTVACVGECSEKYTGSRDGKTLHGYVSRELLHAMGVACTTGFYHSYEQDIIDKTSNKVKYAFQQQQSDLSFLSRALIKLRTGIGSSASVDEVRFDIGHFGSKIRLRGKSYKKMLSFAPYMGNESKYYYSLLDELKEPKNKDEAATIIERIKAIEINNQFLRSEIKTACASLMSSLSSVKRQ